jgi:hypothetical protein
MGHNADIVSLTQGRDLDHFGDAADVGQRGPDEIQVVVLHQAVEVPALAPLFAGRQRATGHGP